MKIQLDANYDYQLEAKCAMLQNEHDKVKVRLKKATAQIASSWTCGKNSDTHALPRRVQNKRFD